VPGLDDGTVVAVAAGFSHSFALNVDGTVLAWGSNFLGQLGDGTTANRSSPVPVTGLPPAQAIVPGAALTRDGAVYAWGGQLPLDTAELDAALPVGASKLGGCPDLPAGTPWPSRNERPMAFVAQIDLADIAPLADGELPPGGLLSFFSLFIDWGFGGSEAGRVIHTPAPATLTRIAVPAGLPAGERFARRHPAVAAGARGRRYTSGPALHGQRRRRRRRLGRHPRGRGPLRRVWPLGVARDRTAGRERDRRSRNRRDLPGRRRLDRGVPLQRARGRTLLHGAGRRLVEPRQPAARRLEALRAAVPLDHREADQTGRQDDRNRLAAGMQRAERRLARRAAAQVRPQCREILHPSLADGDRREQAAPALALGTSLELGAAPEKRAPPLRQATIDLPLRPTSPRRGAPAADRRGGRGSDGVRPAGAEQEPAHEGHDTTQEVTDE